MTLAVIILLASVLALLTGCAGALFYYKNRISNDLYNYFTRETEDKPSQFEQFIGACGKIVANEMLITLKAQSMQAMGAMSKNASAIESAIAKDAIASSNPTLGMGIEMLMDNSPNLKKLFEKRPQLWGFAAQLAQGLTQGGNNHSSGKSDFAKSLAEWEG